MLLHPSPLISTFVTMSRIGYMMMGYVKRDTRGTLKRMEESFADERDRLHFIT